MGVRLSAVSMAFVVMVRKAYGESFTVGYPNLAGKANLRVVLHSEKKMVCIRACLQACRLWVKFETGFSRRVVGQVPAAKAACLYALVGIAEAMP
jgi:hypothetical protein